jgi:hypothetical protein
MQRNPGCSERGLPGFRLRLHPGYFKQGFAGPPKSKWTNGPLA